MVPRKYKQNRLESQWNLLKTFKVKRDIWKTILNLCEQHDRNSVSLCGGLGKYRLV